MRELDGRRMVSRIKGRPSLERRLRGLLIAAHRFARARAVTAADRDFAIRLLDGLTSTLHHVERTGADGHRERV
jgi:hypothetical protein